MPVSSTAFSQSGQYRRLVASNRKHRCTTSPWSPAHLLSPFSASSPSSAMTPDLQVQNTQQVRNGAHTSPACDQSHDKPQSFSEARQFAGEGDRRPEGPGSICGSRHSRWHPPGLVPGRATQRAAVLATVPFWHSERWSCQLRNLGMTGQARGCQPATVTYWPSSSAASQSSQCSLPGREASSGGWSTVLD